MPQKGKCKDLYLGSTTKNGSGGWYVIAWFEHQTILCDCYSSRLQWMYFWECW